MSNLVDYTKDWRAITAGFRFPEFGMAHTIIRSDQMPADIGDAGWILRIDPMVEGKDALIEKAASEVVYSEDEDTPTITIGWVLTAEDTLKLEAYSRALIDVEWRLGEEKGIVSGARGRIRIRKAVGGQDA